MPSDIVGGLLADLCSQKRVDMLSEATKSQHAGAAQGPVSQELRKQRSFCQGSRGVSTSSCGQRTESVSSMLDERAWLSSALRPIRPIRTSFLAYSLGFAFPFAQVLECVLLADQAGQQACLTVAGSPSTFRKRHRRVHAFVNQGSSFISQ